MVRRLTLMLLTSFFGVINAFGAQWAEVKSEKAVVYSDPEMSSSIGFVSFGKRLRVGSVPKNYGLVLPIIVSNRVGYIKVEDIYTEEELEEREKLKARLEKMRSRKTLERKLSIRGNQSVRALSYDQEEKENKEYTVLFSGGGIGGYYLNYDRDKYYKIEIDFSTGSFEEDELDILMFNLGYMRPLFGKLYFYGSLLLVPYSQYRYESLVKANGQGAGLQVGIEWMMAISDRLSLHFDAYSSYLALSGFPAKDQSLLPEELSMNIISSGGTLSLSYTY